MPDLDLEVKGAPVIQTLRKEGGGGDGLQNNFFGPGLRAPVWSKNKGGGGGLPGPSPGSAIGFRCSDV